MTKEPVREALYGVEHSLGMVDSARHALSLLMELMHEENPNWCFEHACHCILYTLDAAVKQGQADFDIVWEAMKQKAA